MGLESLLARLERRAVTPVTPAPATAVTPEPAPCLGCTSVTSVTPASHERALVTERITEKTAAAMENAVDDALPHHIAVAPRVRCSDCRHFVQIEYPRLGRCAIDRPAPERGGLFWGHDVHSCAAFDHVPNWPAGPRPESSSRLHASLRLVSIEAVVPLDELLVFYRGDLDGLAALSLDDLRRTVADYKAHRVEYQRLLDHGCKPLPAEPDEVAAEQSSVARVTA